LDRKHRPIVFIDNKDSFVWNLVDYVSMNYEETVVLPNTVPLQSVLEMNPAGVVISPGPGHPANQKDIGTCIEIITEMGRSGVPVLGVCLGHQAINLAFGGTIGHTRPLHGKTSMINHDAQGIFKGLKSPLTGGRYHSLAIEKLSPSLNVSATSSDGVIMGVRHESLPIQGVQFHPESVLTPDGMKMIANWVEEVLANTCTP
jgi:anthranilate synthase component 2